MVGNLCIADFEDCIASFVDVVVVQEIMVGHIVVVGIAFVFEQYFVVVEMGFGVVMMELVVMPCIDDVECIDFVRWHCENIFYVVVVVKCFDVDLVFDVVEGFDFNIANLDIVKNDVVDVGIDVVKLDVDDFGIDNAVRLELDVVDFGIDVVKLDVVDFGIVDVVCFVVKGIFDG